MGFFLEPCHNSVRKRQIMSPKFYLFDTGVARAFDFGSETAPLKTATKRTNVEISKFRVMDKPATMIGKNSMLIEGGECYLIAQWSEDRV